MSRRLAVREAAGARRRPVLAAAGILIVLVIAAWAVPVPVAEATLRATATYAGGPPGSCEPCHPPHALLRVRLDPTGPRGPRTSAGGAGRVRIRLRPGVYTVSWGRCGSTAIVLPGRTARATPTCQVS